MILRPATGVRYTVVAIVLHWAIAALVIGQFALGWWMQSIPKQPPGLRADAFNVHKSIGLTILVLMLARLAWRIANRPPPLPPMPSWQAMLARFTHGLLYAALIGQALVGYLGSAFSGYPVKYFGRSLPQWAARNDALKEWLSVAHLALGWVIAAALLMHVAGALAYAFIDRDRLLASAWESADQRGRRAVPHAAFEKQGRLLMRLLRRHVGRGLAAVVLEVGARTGIEQRLHGLALAEARGPHEGREVVVVDHVRVHAARERHLHEASV